MSLITERRSTDMVTHPVNACNCVLKARAQLGEGPVWDDLTQQLYWVDINGHRIHRYDETNGDDTVIALAEPVTCVALTHSEDLLIAQKNEVALLTPKTGVLRPVALVEMERGTRFNDGKVDPGCRLWIGTMSPGTPGGASLWRLAGSGDLEAVQSGLTVSNGLGWSPDSSIFYLTDSADRIIYAYDYDVQSGNIANRRVFADLKRAPASPDGLAVDAEGCVWSAQWNGWSVIRFDPDGREMRRFPIPVQRPTSCAFGGADMKSLFITSASVGLSETEIQRCPQSGDLFCLETGVRGLPTHRFNF